jgi:hypothetical protein
VKRRSTSIEACTNVAVAKDLVTTLHLLRGEFIIFEPGAKTGHTATSFPVAFNVPRWNEFWNKKRRDDLMAVGDGGLGDGGASSRVEAVHEKP